VLSVECLSFASLVGHGFDPWLRSGNRIVGAGARDFRFAVDDNVYSKPALSAFGVSPLNLTGAQISPIDPSPFQWMTYQ
jgi:hypothetical protein